MEKPDMINHPKHYTFGKIEVIKIQESIMSPEEFRGYMKGQVTKYVCRERHKNGLEDLKKARWYLDYLIRKLERESSND